MKKDEYLHPLTAAADGDPSKLPASLSELLELASLMPPIQVEGRTVDGRPIRSLHAEWQLLFHLDLAHGKIIPSANSRAACLSVIEDFSPPYGIARIGPLEVVIDIRIADQVSVHAEW